MFFTLKANIKYMIAKANSVVITTASDTRKLTALAANRRMQRDRLT